VRSIVAIHGHRNGQHHRGAFAADPSVVSLPSWYGRTGHVDREAWLEAGKLGSSAGRCLRSTAAWASRTSATTRSLARCSGSAPAREWGSRRSGLDFDRPPVVPGSLDEGEVHGQTKFGIQAAVTTALTTSCGSCPPYRPAPNPPPAGQRPPMAIPARCTDCMVKITSGGRRRRLT